MKASLTSWHPKGGTHIKEGPGDSRAQQVSFTLWWSHHTVPVSFPPRVKPLASRNTLDMLEHPLRPEPTMSQPPCPLKLDPPHTKSLIRLYEAPSQDQALHDPMRCPASQNSPSALRQCWLLPPSWNAIPHHLRSFSTRGARDTQR